MGVIFRNDSSREHDPGAGHPERVERIVAIERALAERDWLGCEVRESPAAAADVVARVHPPDYTEALQALCARGGGMIDSDTVVSERSYDAALHAAGGAVALVDALVGGERFGASLHRPPGHHAEAARAMGFCLLNSVAVAARHAVVAHGLSRVMIVDWDVHHGNGTNDIFTADPTVLFSSIHQSPLYPGTGQAADAGVGPGAGWTVNLPVPPRSGDETFVSLVVHVLLELMRLHRPELLLISAGFDAHADDPLAMCEVTDDGYFAMASALRAGAEEIGVGVGVVLEGGYDLGALSRGTVATLGALAAPDGAGVPELAEHPLATRARERLALIR